MTANPKKENHVLSDSDDHFSSFSNAQTRTPSWFVQEPEHQDSASDENDKPSPSQIYFESRDTQALEAYRRRLDEKIREGQALYDRPHQPSHTTHPVGPQKRRPTLPMNDLEGRRRLYQLEEAHNQNEMAPQRRKTGVSWGSAIGLGTIAVMIGAGAGLGFTNLDLLKQKYQNTVDTLRTSSTAFLMPVATTTKTAAVASHETVIGKKLVNTATLDVSDVKGILGDMIPLALTAQSNDAAEPFSLQVSGLPSQAYLTAGVKSAQGNWVLKPADLADLKLVVPQTDANQFEVEVAAIEDRTGELAAPIKALNVQIETAAAPATAQQVAMAIPDPVPDVVPAPVIVRPVSAAPETAINQPNLASAIPAPASKADDLVTKGDSLLQSGDLVSARQFYLKASDMGSAKGSFGVARTYDPKIYAQLNVVGLEPDAAQAASWYQKAAQAGVVDAAP
jgi:hypothetical protein